MTDSIPQTEFKPGVCIFTSASFEALLAHRVAPHMLVYAHTTLMPGTMTAAQLQERLMAVLCGQTVVSHFRLKGRPLGPATADLVVTTDADRSITVVQLVKEVEPNRKN